LQTSQGYIIRILQHFATKLWNINNFVMLFQAMKFLFCLDQNLVFYASGQFKFTVNQSSQNPEQHTYSIHISESHCYIGKSNNPSTVFAVLYKSVIKIKIILSCCHGNTDVNASLRSSV
jgi:hypothetical protein